MRMIDVISPPGSVGTVQSLAESHGLDHWVDAQGEDGRQMIHILVGAQGSQKILDRLQAVLANAENARIIISNVEATLPVIEDDADPGKGKTKGISSSWFSCLRWLPLLDCSRTMSPWSWVRW